MTKITAMTAAALLVAGIGFANAQGTTAPSPVASNKCWDVSTNTAKDKMPATGTSTTGSAASGATAGSTPSGSAGSTAGSAGAPAAGAPAATAAARPAGMPNC